MSKRPGRRRRALPGDPPEGRPEALPGDPPEGRPEASPDDPPSAAAGPRPRAPGFTALAHEPLPRPTFWPALLAFAVTFLLWGIVSAPFIAGMGALLFIVSLAGWIGDIRHETRSH